MTKAQRKLIEECIVKANRGPSLSFIGTDCNSTEAERQARIWSETWIGDSLQALLDNVDGKISAHQLADYA